MTSRQVKCAAAVCALLMAAVAMVRWYDSRVEAGRLSAFDAKGMYEAIPLGCRADEAVGLAGRPEGDHTRFYYFSHWAGTERSEPAGSEWRGRSTRVYRWMFDKGAVLVSADDEGRVIGKEYIPNSVYGVI